jgi:uncharacterized repeat protein (TIGR03803 family)
MPPDGFGYLYKLDPAGNVTVLQSLEAPLGGVIRDSAGHLYGTTQEGGTHLAGTIYKVAP